MVKQQLPEISGYIFQPLVDPINFTVKRADGTIFRTGQVSNANSQEISAGPTGSSGYLFIPSGS